MVLYTSCISSLGVDAPATIPTCCDVAKREASNSDASTIHTVLPHFSRQISKSFLVLALCRPPTTTMPSHRAASSRARLCRSSVTLHIVPKILAFVYSFFIIFSVLFHLHKFCVVCAAKMGILPSFFCSFRHASTFSTSSAVAQAYFSPLARLITPLTSGWFLSPKSRKNSVSGLVASATFCTFCTNGQVQSTNVKCGFCTAIS